MPRRPRAAPRTSRRPRGRPRRAARARRAAGNVTLQDVARITGVSAVTVSRVLNRPELVSAATADVVRRAISRTGYVPNLLAGGLASSRSRLVAAIVPTVTNSMFVETIQALTDRLWEARYHVVLGLAGYSPREEALITEILGRRPDALFVVGVNHTPEARRRILEARIPVVEGWDLTETPLDMVVGFSHEKIGAAIGEYLVGRGYRRFASVWANDERGARRRRGLLQVLRRHGLEELAVSVMPAPSNHRMGHDGLADLLARGVRPDVVVCSSDTIAHGVLAEARVRGIAVPADLAVMGFADLGLAVDAVPALSTVRIDRQAIGRLAAEALLAELAGTPPPERIVDVGFELVERESTCGAAPAGHRDAVCYR